MPEAGELGADEGADDARHRRVAAVGLGFDLPAQILVKDEADALGSFGVRRHDSLRFDRGDYSATLKNINYFKWLRQVTSSHVGAFTGIRRSSLRLAIAAVVTKCDRADEMRGRCVDRAVGQMGNVAHLSATEVLACRNLLLLRKKVLGRADGEA